MKTIYYALTLPGTTESPSNPGGLVRVVRPGWHADILLEDGTWEEDTQSYLSVHFNPGTDVDRFSEHQAEALIREWPPSNLAKASRDSRAIAHPQARGPLSSSAETLRASFRQKRKPSPSSPRPTSCREAPSANYSGMSSPRLSHPISRAAATRHNSHGERRVS